MVEASPMGYPARQTQITPSHPMEVCFLALSAWHSVS